MGALIKNKKFLHSTAILVGTMVGVGVFGIPFAFAKAGFWIGLIFLIFIGKVTYLLDVIYGEIVLRTSQPHQLVGYAKLYLGDQWKRVMFFSIILTTYAALLAYIIIVGDFLANVLSPVFYLSATSFSVWFFAIASLLVLSGIRAVAWVELFLACLFVVVIFLVFVFGAGDINLANYSMMNPEFWFFPYGVLLFAFAGMSSIPIQRGILIGNEHFFKKSILTAVIFVGLLYLIFGFTVVGISGDATSPDAISGLVDFVGPGVIFLGSLFGAAAVSTSFLMLGTAMLEVFHLDYGLSRRWSWLLVVLPPLVLFWGGLRNFIDIISLAGGVAIGLEAFVLILIFIKAKSRGDRVPEYSLNLPAWLLYSICAIFIGGLIYTLFSR